MVFSQLIYTSSKNCKPKGYGLYSKSLDITEDEMNNILGVMRYEAPSFLPFTPTMEEIQTIFPKNFAYFRLPSGRYCIAQSTYIGQDYSNRWGNYIIHAYVSNEEISAIPANLIGAPIFRLCLTQEELDAEQAPASLPQVKIDTNGNAITEQEIKAFFNNSQRVAVLKQLVKEGIAAATIDGKKIKLVDDAANFYYWLKAISFLLPKSLTKNLFFSTYAVEEAAGISVYGLLPGNTATNCQPVSFSQDVAVMEASETPLEVKDLFVNDVCDTFLSDYLGCARKIREIETILATYQTADLDYAIKIYQFKKGDFRYISSMEEFSSILQEIKAHEKVEASFYEAVFRYLITDSARSNSPITLSIFKDIFTCLSTNSQGQLLLAYVDSHFKNSQNLKGDVYATVKEKCPCDWKVALQYLVQENFLQHICAYKTFSAYFFALNVALETYPAFSVEQQKALFVHIGNIFYDLIALKTTSVLRDTVALVKKKATNEDFFVQLFYLIFNRDFSFFHTDVEYLFAYLQEGIQYENYFWTGLCRVLSYYPDITLQCTGKYDELVKNNPKAAEKLAIYGTKYPQVKDFLDNLAIYRLGQEEISSKELVVQVYEKSIRKTDLGEKAYEQLVNVFFLKVKQYLASCTEKQNVEQSLWIYDKLFKNTPAGLKEKEFINILASAAFEDRSLALMTKVEPNAEKLQRILQNMSVLGLSIDNNGNLYLAGLTVQNAAKRGKKEAAVFWNDVQNGKFINLSVLSKKQASDFSDAYLADLVEIVYCLYGEGVVLQFGDLIQALICPLANSENFEKSLLKAWKKLGKATEDCLKEYFDYMFSPNQDAFSLILHNALDTFLQTLSKATRKDIFATLKEECLEKALMTRYISNYENKHQSWFKKLFSVKKKEKKNGKK